jgi:hypothetical protein
VKRQLPIADRGQMPSESELLAYSAIQTHSRGRTMQRMILVSLMLFAALPVGGNAANTT